MKIYYIFIMALFLGCQNTTIQEKTNSPIESQTREEIDWYKVSSIEGLLQEAKKQQKPIFIDLYATWCEPCKEMDQLVYKRVDIKEAMKPFLSVKLDGEVGVGKLLYDKYEASGFPTLLFLLPDGTEMQRIPGSIDAETFLQILQKYNRVEENNTEETRK